MNSATLRSISLVLGTSLLAASIPAFAQKQKTVEKKIYCWDENGSKVCGDALPATAVDSARTEFSASGMPTRRVDRALTDEERSEAARLAEQQRLAALEAAAEIRRELAMVESYASEDELQRAFNHRIELIRSSLETSRLGIDGARRSLLSLLQRAAETELAGKPVNKALGNQILAQHHGLRQQQEVLEQQLQEQQAMDEELTSALERYRELKTTDSNGRG